MKLTARILICLNLVMMSILPLKAGDFDIKAMYLDFRTEVMTMPAMKAMADQAAKNGMNAIIVEWEGSFPFKENATLRNKYCFSEDEVRSFISYCSSLGIDVIPLQNCFGHCQYILRHERYANLREDDSDLSQVCPSEIDEAKKVFKSIFKDITDVHTSKYLHIGCDETRLLGHCSKCSKHEKGELFANYVTEMCKIVSSLGKTPVLWADIVLKYPESLSKIPKNAILLDWNYGWETDRFGKMDNLLKSGHTIWGACAMRSHPDNMYLIQWAKHLNNIFNYTKFAAENGFKGIVNTSWSTSGLYSYVRDDGNEVVDIVPIRQVYPQSGCDMLNEAFASALSGSCSSPEEFLDKYCRENLGLAKEEDRKVVMDYFQMPQPTVKLTGQGGEAISKELDRCQEMKERLSKVNFPSKSALAGKHLKLMLDIRINYLKFKDIESIVESKDFNADMADKLSSETEDLAKECEDLRHRFISLNSEYLKAPADIFNENTYYGEVMDLKQTLNARRK